MRLQYPTTYIAWDLETSGLEKEKCNILEIGYAKVEHGEIVDRRSWILNYEIDLSEKIIEITGLTREIISEKGIDPTQAIQEFLDLMIADPTMPHLTHNGMRFDIEWLAYHAAKTLKWTKGQHASFLDNLYLTAIDTAVFVKAGKLGLVRYWNESFKDFSSRVMNVIAKGVKYNVGICCDELGIDRTGIEQHRALGDVELTNEIYKRLIAQ